MKIEKVNEHQIRCTLTQEDLASRRLKLSELAYGSDKAKDLFRDMMERANDECGFDADNIPLMIEAIPINPECIVLIITKVEDPEEFDTRFSKFAPGIDDISDDEDDDDGSDSDDFVSIKELFNQFKDASAQTGKGQGNAKTAFDGMAFSFASVTELAGIAKSAAKFFHGQSSLYFDSSNEKYLLVINRSNMDMAEFVQVCNLFGEYGEPTRGRLLAESYLKEHFEVICEKDAVATLAEIA
ncbi:MAG: adaptor protein MecA [Lachnospiraceae bacterium]|nr:adaptor protein MecA [Lachnospiraceae bacterium]